MSIENNVSREEADLSEILDSFKRIINKFLGLCLAAIMFFVKLWWVFLILIIIGVGFGVLMQGGPDYKAELIVKSNYETQPYLYNAVTQFNNKLKDKDSIFLMGFGINTEKPELKKVEIKPIVNLVGLLDESKIDSRNLEIIVKELEIDDDTNLMSSELFYSSYLYHRITVTLRDENDTDKIKLLFDYINQQPYILALRNETLKNQKDHIQQNDRAIVQIDSVIASYYKNINIAANNSSNLSYFNNQNNLNIEGLFARKITLIEETEILKNELIGMDEAVVAVSTIQSSKDQPFFKNKYILYPIILVGLFIFIMFLKFLFIALKASVEKNKV